MFLRQLFQKQLFVKGVFRGVCIGVGVSKKNHAVKYLLCSSTHNTTNLTRVDFTVNFSSLTEVFSGGLHLSALRPVYPKNTFSVFPTLPVYAQNGVCVGFVNDGEVENGVLESLTIGEKRYPFHCVSACADAVLLKAPKPYPLGITLPDGNGFVTKTVLKNNLKNGNLIKFTLSLAPFDCKAN